MPSPIVTGPWIGIPDPPFGLTETAPARPSPWTSPTAGYYYINGTTGSDSGNSLGTPAAPRKTIPRALAAGAYVEVHGTDAFDYADPNQIVCSGTALSPVWIRGQDTSTRPTFAGSLTLKGSYAIVEYITVDSPDGMQLAQGDHLVARHLECLDVSVVHSPGLSIAPDVAPFDDPLSYHVVWDCLIHDCGDWTATEDEDNHGMTVRGVTDHAWILGCEFYHCSGDGVQVNAGTGAGALVHHIYIAGNVAHHNKQTGFWCKQATDVVFSQNVCYGLRPDPNPPFSPGVGLGGQYAPNRVWYIFNEVYDCDYGIQFASDLVSHGASDAIYYVSNVIHDLVDFNNNYSATNAFTDAAISIRGSRYHYLINNTIYNTGAHGVCATSTDLIVQLYGNIIDTIDPSGRHLFVVQADSAANTAGNGNVFCPNFRYDLAGATGTVGAPLSGTDKVSLSAGFVSAGTDDYHLADDAVALETEATDYTAVYDAYETIHGVSIQVDFDNVARPQGALFDAGAFEGESGPPTNTPTGGASENNHMPYLEINGNPSFNTLYHNGAIFAHTADPTQGDGLNTFVGLLSGNQTLVGADVDPEGTANTAFGYRTMPGLTTGTVNTAVGSLALDQLTSGSENTAVGGGALAQMATGIRNTAVGGSAMNETTGDNNVAIGDGALRGLTTGNNNIGIGTVVGYNAGSSYALVTGSQNVFIGHQAGQGSSSVQVSNSIVIGSSATVTLSKATVIGTQDNSTQVTIYGKPTNALLTGTLSNPTGTTSAVGVMCGFGSVATVTPTVTGRVLALFNGNLYNSSTGGGAAQIKFGTGTAPANGTASTGTSLGSPSAVVAAVSSGRMAVMMQGMVSTLVLNTAYWFDVEQASALVNNSTTNLTGCAITLVEL